MNSSQFFKMLRTAHLVTQHDIPYDLNLQHPCSENLKFCTIPCEISDVFHIVVEVITLLSCYTVLVGSCIPMFWNNLSVRSVRDGQAILPWKKRSIGFLKNLTNKHHPVLLNNSEERRPVIKSYF